MSEGERGQKIGSVMLVPNLPYDLEFKDFTIETDEFNAVANIRDLKLYPGKPLILPPGMTIRYFSEYFFITEVDSQP